MSPTSTVLRTIGVSKKVTLPSYALGVVGVALVAGSLLVSGLEDLREAGIALIAASPLGGLIGYFAPAAEVKPELPPS